MIKIKGKSVAETDTLSARNERILQVATTVFATRGYRNTDVQEIADLLEIGKGTVYRAFGTKEELFFSTVEYGMRQLSERLATVSKECSGGKGNALEHWLLTFFTFFDENPELAELLMQERSEFRDRSSHSYVQHWLSNTPVWRARIQENIDSGRMRPVDPEATIDAVSALCYGTIFIAHFSNKKINLEATAKSLSELIHFGTLSEGARAEYCSQPAQYSKETR